MKKLKKMPDKDISEANEPKPVLKKPTFSKPQLILFASAFALIGGYTLFRTFAAESVIASLEAEQMVLPHKAQVIADSSASAGKAVKLTGSVTATASVNLPANTTSLTLSAKATKPCRFSNITVKLYVDDTLVMSRKVNSSNWTKFSVAKKLPKGVHKLSIEGSGINSISNFCSSELSLDVVNFTGNSTPPTPAPTISFSASPTSVTAGGAATLTWNSTNATSCSASGAWSGAKPTSGSASTGALNATATYNLTCQGASGTVSASSTVNASAAPTPPPSTPPPPSSSKLLWAAPVLSNPLTINATNSNSKLYLDNSKDYIIKMPTTPLTAKGGLWLIGGRNIVVIGGEIFNDTPITAPESVDSAYGLYLKGQTGIVHLEGLWIHGKGLGQALIMDQGNGATIQVQRSRFETLHPVGYVHTDGIQTWRGPHRLKMGYVTIITHGVGIQTMPHQYGNINIDTWEYRHVNIEQKTPDAYALWKGAHSGGYWREIHEDFWVKNLGHLAWPDAAHWNPGGPAKIEGEAFHQGLRPAGDFVPAGQVGLSYKP